MPVPTSPSSSGIDWPRVHAEALAVLQRYLRIDTSNPPGHETPAAHFLGDLLAAEGIACEYIEEMPGRAMLIARLPGDGSRRPLMLANHTDVVPVEAEYWDVPPFSGLIRDGRVYGRGAVDMKSAGVMQLFAMLLLHRLGLPLRRDLIFVAVPDEEGGGEGGMGWLARNRPELFDVECCINEGGTGMADFGGRPARLFEVAITEKEMSPLQLIAVGTPGHASKPAADNSAVRLIAALARLARWDRGLTLTPITRAYLEGLHAAGLIGDLDDRAALDAAIHASPDSVATFSNTLNITMIDVGMKFNVVPARSTATIDCRLVPGQDRHAWLREVEAVIDDPLVSVEFILPDAEAPAVSPEDTELFRVIRDVCTEAFEDAAVVASTSIVGTDNRFTRLLGVPSYGFIPALLSQSERDGFHGHNEFITVDNLNMGLELMYEVVRRMVT